MSGFEYKQGKDKNRQQFKKHGASERYQEESDLPSMIKKMQQQLVFLERKIDLLLGQSPSRTEGYSPSYSSKKREDGFGERSSYKGNKLFAPRSSGRENKPGEKSFFKGKKSFSSKKRSVGKKKSTF